MREKFCMEVGESAGIGHEITRVLAEQQAHVMLVSRDERYSASLASDYA